MEMDTGFNADKTQSVLISWKKKAEELHMEMNQFGMPRFIIILEI